jgi:hypothetical protein
MTVYGDMRTICKRAFTDEDIYTFVQKGLDVMQGRDVGLHRCDALHDGGEVHIEGISESDTKLGAAAEFRNGSRGTNESL